MLKEILKHTSHYLNDDVKEWISKKALQGSKNDSWEILSITTNLLYYHLFRTEETINYKKNRLWFRQNPLYIKSNDETNYKKKILTFEKLYNKVRERRLINKINVIQTNSF
jgi:hypothetical protein